MAKIRVAMYGNTADNFGDLARALARFEDVSVTLLQDGIDPTLSGKAPSSSGPYHTAYKESWLAGPFPRTSPLVRWANSGRCDVLLLSDMGIMMAPYVSCPTIALPIGFDLTVLPRNLFPRKGSGRGLSPLIQSRNLAGRTMWMLRSHLQLRGLARSSHLFVVDAAPFREAVSELDLELLRARAGRHAVHYTRRWIPIDAARFSPSSGATLPNQLSAIRARSDFLLFHPSRLMMQSSSEHRRTGQWKNSQAMLLGFRGFLDTLPVSTRTGIQLMLVDRPVSHSPDISEARELIAKLNLCDNVQWLMPAEGATGIPREQLPIYYAASDAGIGSLGRPWYGSVVMEFLSSGVPLIQNFDEQSDIRHLGEAMPALYASSATEVTRNLSDLYHDPHMRAAQGRRGREWVKRFHSYEALGSVWRGWLRDVL